jgi:PAS domain S-box-containing protein
VEYLAKPNLTEKLMRDDDFIVSQTDTKGLITYCNRTFQNFAGYSENKLLGAPHNIIRHPDMPRGLFKLVWEKLNRAEEVMAYIKNMAADGSYYWTFATMTPSYNSDGQISGYFSVRVAPKRYAVKTMEEIYGNMALAESRASTSSQPNVSLKVLSQMLAEKGLTYEKFILSL